MIRYTTVLVGAIIVGVLTVFLYINAKPTQESSGSLSEKIYTAPLVDENWIRINEESLGISLAVPQTIWAYQNLEQDGCEQKLIFGLPHESLAVTLMPQYDDCDYTIDLREFGDAENYYAKRITVLPAATLSEIEGVITSRLVDHALLVENTECAVRSLTVTTDEYVATLDPEATIPVRLTTDPTCPINPHALSVQYSTTYKKVVIIEAGYAFGHQGDYYTSVSDSGSEDLAIFQSLKVFR